MAVELRISEYVPRTVIWTKRLCKGILLGCLAAIVVLFATELLEVEELRTQCTQVEEAALRYEELVAEGDAHCNEGEMRLGEQCYLAALQFNQVKPEPYLRLAQLYTEYRYYDLALRILEDYPGEEEAVAAAIQEMQDKIARLESSIFQEIKE